MAEAAKAEPTSEEQQAAEAKNAAAKSNMRQNLTGKQKAAMFLISIGPDKSAEILRHLKDEEIEEITKAIAGIKKLKNTYQDKVIEEFYQLSLAQEYITEGGINYAKEILEKAFGSSKSEILLKKMTASLKTNGPFDFAKSMDPVKIAQLIKDEHPQTIALILYNIKYQQSATILAMLPKNIQADVARRIAMMEKPSYDIVKQVEEILQKKISYDYMNDEMNSTISGVETLTEILRAVDRGTEQKGTKGYGVFGNYLGAKWHFTKFFGVKVEFAEDYIGQFHYGKNYVHRHDRSAMPFFSGGVSFNF